MMATGLRHRVDPGDVPAAKAARRLGLTETSFLELLPALRLRGFPPADETTGMFDLDAIDQWRKTRHPNLFLTSPSPARHAKDVVADRLGGRLGG